MSGFESLTFGQRLQAFRKNRRITQAELAKQAMISREAVGNYENDRRKPPLDISARLASALHVSLDALHFGTVFIGDAEGINWDLSEEALQEHITMYKNLDARGRRVVDIITQAEVEQLDPTPPDKED